MALARFKALNTDSSEDSEGDEENPAITREALEEKAAAQYRDILAIQRNKQWKEAETKFKELLDSDVLSRVSGTINYVSGRIQPSLIHLKYCLHVNLGHVLIETGQIKEALDSYLQAIELDDRDLNLWYRIGQTAIKIPNLNLAAHAFQEALQCNDNHWPSLDTLITVLYAAGKYMSCLYHIAEGLKLDDDFFKGIVFCQKIFKEHPSFERDFPLYYPECKFDESVLKRDVRSEVDEEALDRLLDEAETLRRQHEELFRPKKSADFVLGTIRSESPLPKRCWVAVGRTLLQIYAKLKEQYPLESFLRIVDLTHDNEEEEKDKSSEEEKNTDYEWYDAADDDDASDDEVAKLTEGGSALGQGGETGGGGANEEGVGGGACAVRASKRRRSSPSLLDQWTVYSSKRRSARVRSCAWRRDEPSLARSLRRLLPEYLWPSREPGWCTNGDDSMDTMDLYRLFEAKDNAAEQMLPTNALTHNQRTKLIKEEGYFNTDKEVEDVNKFLGENKSVNILSLITNYVKIMAQKWNLHWSPALIAIYIKIYKLIRQHYPEACQLSSEPLDTESSLAVLLYGELLLDRWLSTGKERGAPSPLTGSVFGGDFSSLSFGNLAFVANSDVANEDDDAENDAEFVARCYWLEAVMYLQAKCRDAALLALERYLADERCCGVQVKLKNVVNNFFINEDGVMRLFNTLRRNEDLDKVSSLFANGEDDKACAILKHSLQPISPVMAADCAEPLVDRCTQFSLLLDSLFARTLHAECLAWCELACHEALAQYRTTVSSSSSSPDETTPPSTSSSRSRWSSLLANTLIALPLCLEEGPANLLKTLTHARLVRLIQTMSNIICLQMEAPTDTSEIPLGTVAPWVVLYHIVKYDEEKTGRVHDEDDISASLNVLLTAHEYLGKRSWCLIDEAEILYKILSVTMPLMETLPADSELVTTLSHHVEQAFYCLYGHPLKKNKPRHIIEHNVMGLALTWGRSHLVYRYFRPRDLPMYDSSVRCSISQDTEALFRRIIGLVPTDMDPSRQVDAINAFVEGETDRLPLKGVQLSPEVADIYYLIADYYFKNKFWSKALRYYLLDVSANVCRVDSWACLALAHGSQLETQLNSCEPLASEMHFLTRTRKASKCYGRALQLDPEQSTLWIEHGSFCYMVHSFCSRLLSQEPPNLSLELFKQLETHKERMLYQAHYCFKSANSLYTSFEKKGEPEIQDERWLHHYMFGKIALKREEKPEIYLTHFLKAMRFLHQNNARYPQSISYSNPQLYSVEALELYYRIHACVLKVLEQSEDKSIGTELRRLFFETLEKIASGPFANYGEITSDFFSKDNVADLPLVQTDVCYTLNNLVNIVSGEDSLYCKQKLQNIPQTEDEENVAEEVEEDDDEEEEEDEEDEEPASKLMKTNNCEAVKCNNENVTETVMKEKVLKKQKSKESESSDSKNENSRDNTDKSEDSNKKSAKKLSESSSETLSDSEASSCESDSSSDGSSSEDSNSVSSESSSRTSSADENDETKSPPKKKVKIAREEKEEVDNWKEEQRCLIDRCLLAMIECQRRFPEHYKSIYRQSHYYFHSKERNDIDKVRTLLLGEGGLFADRRSTNFFNGVWRIPSSEIDRPGSFAGHMSRCLHLLLDLLRDSKDFKMLLSLALQLKDTPDPDKKYLRDTEREQLAREALSQCVQVLRNKLIEANNMSKLKFIVMEVFKAHRKINKLWPKREKIFNALLTQAYKKYSKFKGDNGKTNFEAASKFCLQEINQTGGSDVTSSMVVNISVPVTSSECTVTNNDPVVTTAAVLTSVTTTVTVTTSSVISTPSTSAGISLTTTITPSVVSSKETTVKSSSALTTLSTASVPPSVMPPNPVVKRPRGRPSNVSIRHPNPSSFLKAASIPSSKDIQMMYQNLPFSKHQLPLMMPPNPLTAGLSLQQQINLQTELLRQMSYAQAGSKASSSNKTQPSLPPISTMKMPSFPHSDKPPKVYGKSLKSTKQSSNQNSYSKAAASAVVQNVPPIRSTPNPLVSSTPPQAPTGGYSQSLQHKLLSAKKAKMSGERKHDAHNSGTREMVYGGSKDPMLSSKQHSTSNTNRLASSIVVDVGKSQDRFNMSMNKTLSKSMEPPKSLLKDLTITPSSILAASGSFANSLNKEDITLTRRMPSQGASAEASARLSELASCSFVDSASNKIKSMFLPQHSEHVTGRHDVITTSMTSSWKPRPSTFEPRISSALAAIGTQLTITPTSTPTLTSAQDKKQEKSVTSPALIPGSGSDIIKYGKADVSIEPVKDKSSKSGSVDPDIITLD